MGALHFHSGGTTASSAAFSGRRLHKPHLSSLAVDQREDSFDVTFWVECRKGDIDFRWKGEIRGAADGQIAYRMSGRAHSTFMRNRIGFCVLHGSVATTGSDCEIQHVDGNCEKSTFPDHIAPHQPCMNVRAIRHLVAPGTAARVICNGDTFETEDQRNWTDASFKTYCTPLALAFPVGVPEGTEISQSIHVSLERESASTVKQACSLRAGSAEPIPTRIGRAFWFPRIGLCVASHGKPLSPRQQQFLSDMKLDHLRVDLSLTANNLEGDLRAATVQANQLNTTLQVAITADESTPDGQLTRLRNLVQTMTAPVSMWLVYDRNRSCTTDSTLGRLRAFLEDVTPDTSFATGTDANFAELNRGRPLTRCADWIGYSVNPQVHVFDDRSIMETLEAQGDTVRTARGFAATVVPKAKPGAMIVCLDPAAPRAGLLPERDDLTYFVTHPAHPPVFNDETDPAARRDFFGSGKAKQAIVCADAGARRRLCQG